MADRGRPRAADSDTRRQQFVRLILTGADWAAAVQAARIAPQRAIVVLDDLHRSGLLPERQTEAAPGRVATPSRGGEGRVSDSHEIVRVYGAGDDRSTHLAYRTGRATLCLVGRGHALRGIDGEASCADCRRAAARLPIVYRRWLRELRPSLSRLAA